MKSIDALLIEIVQDAVKSQLNEMSETDVRMSQLDRLKIETGISSYELLEDVLEQLNGATWKTVLAAIKHKYGYRHK